MAGSVMRYTQDTVLELFTVYENPSDYPGLWVVRRFVVTSTGGVEGKEIIAIASSLARAREPLEGRGLFCSGRLPDDDSCIVETWL